MKKPGTIAPEILEKLNSYTRDDWIRFLQEKKLRDISRINQVSTYIITRYLDEVLHLPKDDISFSDFYFEGVPIATTVGAWMDSKERKTYLQFINQNKTNEI